MCLENILKLEFYGSLTNPMFISALPIYLRNMTRHLETDLSLEFSKKNGKYNMQQTFKTIKYERILICNFYANKISFKIYEICIA